MNIPTKITLSRIIMIVLMLIGLAVLEIIAIASPTTLNPDNLTIWFNYEQKLGINIIYLVVCGLFILAAITDKLDGHLARKWNQITDLGKFLDPVADKLLVNSMVIFLCVPQAYTVNQMAFPLFCAIIMIARDIVVDMLRFVAAKRNIVLAANAFGKLKTVCQMVTIPFVLLNGWPFALFDYNWPPYCSITHILVYITTLASLLSGVIYVVQNLKVFKPEENAK